MYFDSFNFLENDIISQNYMIIKILGKGGHGTVFTGKRKHDGKKVAIKLVKKNNCHSTVKPLEVTLLQKVYNISNVVKILDWIVLQDGYCIVMEKSVGTTDLFDFISEYGFLPEYKAKKIFQNIVITVINCRDAGVLHGDIKDENILIDWNTMEITLIDCGSGCFYNNQNDHEKIFKGQRGTKVYCPPEMIMYEQYNANSFTVWSLGILLYNMLNGDIPFKNDLEICAAQVHFSQNIILSSEAKNLIISCLKLQAHQRITLEQIISHNWFK